MPDAPTALIAAADVLLARRGYRHMTIEDLAREAGVGKGTVYLYFRSKEEIALAVVDAHVRATFEVLRRLAAHDAPAAERLEHMLVARVLERADRFRHYAESLHDLLAAIRPRLLEQREQQLKEEAAIFAEVLRETTGDDAGSASRAAHTLLTGTNSLLPYYLTAEQLGRRSALLRRAREVAHVLVAGILAARIDRGAGTPGGNRRRAAGVMRSLGVALLTIAGSAACHRTPVAPPAAGPGASALHRTPAGRRAAEWFAAYNGGDSTERVAALRALHAPSALSRRSAESRERSLRVWWTDYGALEAVRVDTIRPHSAVITVREARTRGWGQLYVDVDTLPPHHVTGVALIPSVEPPAWPMVERVSEAELAARVGGLAEQLHADGVFDGVVLVTRHGVPLLARAVGLADREAGRPHRLQTPFELASVGKMFTAVAVARLIEQGRLRADATVAQVLPDYPRGASASVTMHQLLTMSSGVPDLFRSPRFWRERTDVRSLTDYWRFFATDSLEFRPGTRWSYSNSNFLLLGAVVERVAGVPFQHFVEEQVFRRAGMRGTTYHGARLAERAAGYSRTSPGDAPGTAPMPGGRFRVGGTSPDTAPGGPAGGGASTAGDLAAFGDSLMRHRLLADSTVRQLFAPHVRAEYGGADGWGFETRTWNGVHIVGHGGAFPGVSNQVDYFPALGIAVVVLSNVDGSGAQAIASYARALISRRHGRTP